MHILVVRNNSNPQAVDASLLLTAYLTSQGIEALLVDSSSLGTDQGRRDVRAQLPGQLALVVVLGGDGTVLHTVHLLHDRQVPILPINFGRLGFLANADTDGVVPLVAEALAGDLRAERRSILSIEVVCEGEHDPYGEANRAGEGAAWDMPDVNAGAERRHPSFGSQARGDRQRPLDAHPGSLRRQRSGALRRTAVLRPERGGHHPRRHGTHHRADPERLGGGRGPHARRRPRRLHGHRARTAYALSAGGPLVSPGFKGMIAVPLAPHTLRSRAVVTDASDVIEVGFDDTDEFREATLFVDGDIVPFDAPLRKIYVQCAPFDVTLLCADGASFYDRISKDFFGE